jgi:DNA replication protein DnaC
MNLNEWSLYDYSLGPDVEDAHDVRERIEDTIASIPQRFHWAKLGAAELRERVKPYDAVTIAGKASADAKLIVLTGPTAGVGKTSLGCALLRRLAKREGAAGHYADAIDLAYARRLHPLGKGEAPEVLAAMKAGVLFLDELGAEQGMDQTVEQIVRHRHNAELPTIFGTSASPEALATRYGDGVARRIFEGATVIRLGGAA